MTTTPPLAPWTVTSVLERSYLMARENFPAFVTITLVFGAVSLVVDVLSLGLLAAIVHLVCGVATAICLTWGALKAMGGAKPDWEPMLRQMQGPLFGRLMALGAIQYLVIGISAVLVIPPFFLLPLWIATYLYNGKTWTVLVNANTGENGGSTVVRVPQTSDRTGAATTGPTF